MCTKINPGLNRALNHAQDLSLPVNPTTGEPQGCLGRFVRPRVYSAFNVAPREVGEIAYNALKFAVSAPVAAVRTIILKPVEFISGSKTLKDFNDKLPSLSDVAKTAARIVQFFAGLLSTVFLGVGLSAKWNLKAHIALGLATDLRKEEAADAETEDLIRADVVTHKAAGDSKGDVAAEPAHDPILAKFLADERNRAAAVRAAFDEVGEDLKAKADEAKHRLHAAPADVARVADAAGAKAAEAASAAAAEVAAAVLKAEGQTAVPVHVTVTTKVEADIPAATQASAPAAAEGAPSVAVASSEDSTKADAVITGADDEDDDFDDLEDQKPAAKPGYVSRTWTATKEQVGAAGDDASRMRKTAAGVWFVARGAAWDFNPASWIAVGAVKKTYAAGSYVADNTAGRLYRWLRPAKKAEAAPAAV